jgi:hypothetical protein
MNIEPSINPPDSYWVEEEELDFEMTFEAKKTIHDNIEDCYTLHIPYFLYDDAEESDEGKFRRLELYESELKRIFKLCCQQECIKEYFKTGSAPLWFYQILEDNK